MSVHWSVLNSRSVRRRTSFHDGFSTFVGLSGLRGSSVEGASASRSLAPMSVMGLLPLDHGARVVAIVGG